MSALVAGVPVVKRRIAHGTLTKYGQLAEIFC